MDNVSCYANAVLQCLIHNNIIRKILLKHDDTNTIKTLINDYIDGKNVLNSINIRHFLSEPFSLNMQQDAAEFLTVLCEKITILRDIMGRDLSTTIYCLKCNDTKIKIEQNLIGALTLPTFSSHSIDLKNLIKCNFSHWSSIEGICKNCNENSQLKIKHNFYFAKRIIILQLMLFSCGSKDIFKITKYIILTEDTLKVYLLLKYLLEKDYIEYVVLYIITEIVQTGHYTNMLRVGKKINQNGFMSANRR